MMMSIDRCAEAVREVSVTIIITNFVRPRWPYDMRPSVRAEKYIRDAGPISENRSFSILDVRS